MLSTILATMAIAVAGCTTIPVPPDATVETFYIRPPATHIVYETGEEVAGRDKHFAGVRLYLDGEMVAQKLLLDVDPNAPLEIAWEVDATTWAFGEEHEIGASSFDAWVRDGELMRVLHESERTTETVYKVATGSGPPQIVVKPKE